jgi:hypothetical protein
VLSEVEVSGHLPLVILAPRHPEERSDDIELLAIYCLTILRFEGAGSSYIYANTFSNTGVTKTVITPATPIDKLLIAP